MTAEDRLDAALDSDLAAFAASPEVRELTDVAAEVGSALAAWRLDGEARARIYAIAISNAGRTQLRARLRRLGLDRRVQALAGGGVVTIAAAAAVAVAMARGRRHAPATVVGA
jgi:hypothetical protein